MESKRQEAKQAVDARKATKEDSSQSDDRDIVPWLEALGIKGDRARLLAAQCDDMPDAPIEERIKRALSHHGARLAYRGGLAASRGA